jgi:hypothetical protein
VDERVVEDDDVALVRGGEPALGEVDDGEEHQRLVRGGETQPREGEAGSA